MQTRRKFLARSLVATAGLLTLDRVALAHGDAKHADPKAAGAKAVAVEKEQQDWGIAGDAADVSRSIPIVMTDAMRFEPDRIEVRLGETIRFEHHNDGMVLHEMVIGTAPALEEHAELMKKFPGMEHDSPWMAHVAPGGRGEIVWTFNRPGEFRFACLIPGHYEAGMIGTIIVIKA